MGKTLTPANLALAMERIRAWSAAPGVAVACPECEAVTLEITDRSSRPYTEWYHLSCAACGLDQTISIPLAPPSSY